MKAVGRRSLLINAARATAAIAAAKVAGLLPETAAAAPPPSAAAATWSTQMLGATDSARLVDLARADKDVRSLSEVLIARGFDPDGSFSAVRIVGPEGAFEAVFLGHGPKSNVLYVPGVGAIALLSGRAAYAVRDARVVRVLPDRTIRGAPVLPLGKAGSISALRGPGLAAPLATHCCEKWDACVYWDEMCILFAVMAIWMPALIPAMMGVCATASWYCFQANMCGQCAYH